MRNSALAVRRAELERVHRPRAMPAGYANRLVFPLDVDTLHLMSAHAKRESGVPVQTGQHQEQIITDVTGDEKIAPHVFAPLGPHAFGQPGMRKEEP